MIEVAIDEQMSGFMKPRLKPKIRFKGQESQDSWLAKKATMKV